MKTTISSKLFLGFLVVIFLNVLFVVVVSRFDELYSIARILGWQNQIKDSLLRVSALHANQKTKFLIYDRLKRPEAAGKVREAARSMSQHMDNVLSHLHSIRRTDARIASGDSPERIREQFPVLHQTVDQGILSALAKHDSAFAALVRCAEQPRGGPAAEDSLRKSVAVASDSLVANLRHAQHLLDEQTRLRFLDIENRIANAKTVTILILAGMSAFALIFAFWFSRAMTNSLRRLQQSADAIAKGNFSFDPSGYPADEIGELASALARMAKDLQVAQEDLVRSKRLAAIGEIVASVNHEINNPLMIISGNAQFLEMAMDGYPKKLRERVKVIIDEANRISQVTRKLRAIRNPVVEEYTGRGEQMIDIEKSAQTGSGSN